MLCGMVIGGGRSSGVSAIGDGTGFAFGVYQRFSNPSGVKF